MHFNFAILQMIQKKTKIQVFEPSVNTKNLSIRFKKHGIYHVKVHDNELFTLDFFPLSLKFREEHPHHKPILLLFEFGKFSSVDAETREFSSRREGSPFLAEAVVVTNLAQRLLVKHYAKIMNERGVKVSVFNDTNSAIAWLKSINT